MDKEPEARQKALLEAAITEALVEAAETKGGYVEDASDIVRTSKTVVDALDAYIDAKLAARS